MKKNYLFSLFVGIISVSSFAQIHTYVAGTMKVKVEENTLFYNAGNLVMTSAAAPFETVKNEGNIKIQGQFVNESTTQQGGNFVSTWTDAGNYGQVIIAEGPDGSGYLTMQKGAIDPTKFAYGQLAIPFVYNNEYGAPTVENAFKFLHARSSDGQSLNPAFKGDCPPDEFCGNNRYYQSLFVWGNEDNETEAVATGSVLNPANYYMINLNMASAGYKQLYTDNAKFNYRGIPSPRKHTVSLSATNHPYNATSEWGVGNCTPGESCWKNKVNNYNEKHYTLLEDPTISIANAAATPENNITYAKYIYQFGNPYTSNLDLSRLNFNDNFGGNALAQTNLKGIFRATGVEVGYNQTSVANGAESVMIKATKDESGQWSGDSEVFIVKPFETFMFKFEQAFDFTFTFTDGLKTFSSVPENNPISSNKNGSQFYQLRLNLLNEDATELYNSTFVVAKSNATSARKESYEIAEPIADDINSLYTLQEINEDDLNPEPVNDLLKLYINGINTDYVAKPIYLGFNRVTDGAFVINSSLYEGSIFNRLDNGNFSDGNKYLFYDSKEDVLLEITTDFQYTITSDVQSNSDRYILYWNNVPDDTDLGNEDLASLNQTVIYGEDDIHKIRFAKDWKIAEVSVYDLSGKLISFAKDVDTTSDYTIKLPTNNSAAYLVKTVNEKGEVVTKKIIKK